MKLIRELNENLKTSMDDETFNRLVQHAIEDIRDAGATTDDQMLEIIHSMVENVPGFEETDDAVKLANRVFAQVKSQL